MNASARTIFRAVAILVTRPSHEIDAVHITRLTYLKPMQAGLWAIAEIYPNPRIAISGMLLTTSSFSTDQFFKLPRPARSRCWLPYSPQKFSADTQRVSSQESRRELLGVSKIVFGFRSFDCKCCFQWSARIAYEL